MSNSRQGEDVEPTDPSVSDLAWLGQALFTLPDTVIEGSRRTPTDAHAITWTPLPLRGTTRRLVPTAARFAKQAFENNHDAMPVTRRAAGSATRSLVRAGALRIAPQVQANAAAVFRDPERSVIAAAARGLGQTVESCAITLGPRRYNRKPVVQLMNHRAETIGFLKVGANAVTSAMVATEATTLEQLQQPTPPPLVVPRVLWRSEWQGRSVACFSPVSTAARTLAPADNARLVVIAHAVVMAGGGAYDVELGACALLTRLRMQVDRTADADVHRLLDLAEDRFGAHTVSVGQWHGDFSPWNMISTATSTALIDWEFANNDMPVGSDLLHNRVMVATHLQGQPALHPMRELLARGDNVPELDSMAVPSEQHRPHLLLYLFELIHRDLVLQHAKQTDTGFGVPARAIIEAIMAEADR